MLGTTGEHICGVIHHNVDGQLVYWLHMSQPFMMINGNPDRRGPGRIRWWYPAVYEMCVPQTPTAASYTGETQRGAAVGKGGRARVSEVRRYPIVVAPGLAEQADDAQTHQREARWLGDNLRLSVINDLVSSHHH